MTPHLCPFLIILKVGVVVFVATGILASEAATNLRSYPLPFTVYEQDNANEVAGL